MHNKEIRMGCWLELSNYLNANFFKHYSFDFWNTIAFSNPKFKKARAEYIYNYFDKEFSEEKIDNAFSIVGKSYNSAIENGGETLTINKLYFRVFENIGAKMAFDLEIIKKSIFELFLDYPPIVCEDFIKLLDLIKDSNITLSITSNTTFIPGSVIEKFLDNIQLLNNFSFCVFSDNVLVAKPNQKIFDIILDFLNTRRNSANTVIHIGDNYRADYLGAKYSGLSSFYLDCNYYLANSRNALHVINDIDNFKFSSIEYSKFKFGDSLIAKKYGDELFKYFENYQLPELIVKHVDFLIYSSPYAQIPTSSYYLTQAFLEAFTRYLKINKYTDVNVRLSKIQRSQTYITDYGALSAEERFSLIKNDTYDLVDYPSKEQVCIFIDDISITGTHQRVVEKLLMESGVDAIFLFLYYAKLSNSEICPSFENRLNYAYVTDVSKLMEIVLSDSYKITTRTSKYVLSLQNEELLNFINLIKQNKKHNILTELVNMSNANGYNKIELYSLNLETIKRSI